MIAAFAPATVSNVAAGFDVLGFALDEPGDVVAAELRDEPGVAIVDITGDGGRLTRDAAKNTAGAAVEALLALLGTSRGIVLTIHKGLPLASGVGSSGASAVAAVVAVNELLGRPASLDLVFRAAMAGERAGCGAAHPDNVAPALFGGFVLARSADPPDIVRLPVPAEPVVRRAAPASRSADRRIARPARRHTAVTDRRAPMGQSRRARVGLAHRRPRPAVAIARGPCGRAEAGRARAGLRAR